MPSLAGRWYLMVLLPSLFFAFHYYHSLDQMVLAPILWTMFMAHST